MSRRAPLALVLMLALLGPAIQFLCTDCLNCPSVVTMAAPSCHEDPTPLVTADCCARILAAADSAVAPPAAPAAAPAAAAAAEPTAVRPAATLAVRLPMPPSSGGVHLFTLHSALLI